MVTTLTQARVTLRRYVCHAPADRVLRGGLGSSIGIYLKLLNPLRKAAAAFFKHDLALRRDSAGLQIVLEHRPEPLEKPKKAKKSVSEEAAARKQKQKQELALVHQHLGALLAEVPESRSALRHLVFVERALQKKGLRALQKLPVDVLQRALEQLEGLVTNWSAEGLANLRSKMAVAILEREQLTPAVKAKAEAEAEAEVYPAAAALDAMQMKEVQPDVPTVTDDDALAAAYAALGNMAPSGEIEFHGELGSRSAKAVAPPVPRASETAGDIKLRELQN